MRLVKPSFEIIAGVNIATPLTFDKTPLQLMEKAARTCYQSFEKAWDVCPECGGRGEVEALALEGQDGAPSVPTWRPCTTCQGGAFKTSAHKMVDMLSERAHDAMLEHSWAVLGVPRWVLPYDEPDRLRHLYIHNDGPIYNNRLHIVGGNLRAFSEALGVSIGDLLRLVTINEGRDAASSIPNEIFVAGSHVYANIEKLNAVMVRIVCDRGVSHELVRHRPASFAQESTRYCNYKGGVTFVIPPWMDIIERKYWDDKRAQIELIDSESTPPTVAEWLCTCHNADLAYHDMLVKGWSPQQARSILPNSTKTEIIVTANIPEWKHIFRLRCAKAAHPQMREIMIPLQKEIARLYPAFFEGEG